MSIQISGGGGPSVAEIQSGLATAAALAALATSVAGREQQVGVNAPNHIAVTVDMSSATWKTVGTHEVFTVTGAVRMRLWVHCTEALAGSGSLLLRSKFDAQWTVGCPVGDIYVGFIDNQGNGQSVFSGPAGNIIFDKVTIENVGYHITTNPATDGTLVFHCIWEPLSDGATVVAGAGGPL